MNYKRILEKEIKNLLFKGKAIMIVGPRQVGKTTLSEELIKEHKYIKFNCDNPTERELLSNKDLNYLIELIGEKKIIFIDEAQKVETIGQSVKLLVDHFKKEKQLIITGSSSINLLEDTSESLTGRKHVFTLFPLSSCEIYKDKLEMIKDLEQMLIYGMYPEVVKLKNFNEKVLLLKELNSSYLYRDLLEFQKVKNAEIIFKLVRALSLQVGNEVSYTELSSNLGIDKKTVEHYIELLEKSFIIFRLSAYRRNMRREITKTKKIYFYDLGIRNAVINNFNPLNLRDDVGKLFENYCILERMKFRAYNKINANQFFWRSYEGNEIDLVEEREGKVFAYEFKYSAKKIRVIQNWKNIKQINKENFFELFKK
ncbi:ATP-binding protein [Candidatus Woesearchaeota archaeon]|nr:ATP-binding protein [Candidatus Woesearchaeota archaeon]